MMDKRTFVFPNLQDMKIETLKESKLSEPKLVGYVMGVPIYTDPNLKPDEWKILSKDKVGHEWGGK